MICSSSTIFSRNLRVAAAALLVPGFLLGLSLAGAASAGPSVLDTVRAQARAAMARRDPIAAEVPLREAIRRGVSPEAVRAQLGEALLARGDRQGARQVLGEGGFTPDRAGLGWRVRGELLMADGNLAGAGAAFDQALRIVPGDALLWVAIARLRFLGGEQAQAIEASAHAVELDGTSVPALSLRGMMIREQVGLRAALPWFEAALRRAPDDPGLLAEYAATLGDIGEYRAMLVVCRKLVDVDPGNRQALYLQAVMAARAGKTDLAHAIMDRTGTALRDVPAAILLNGILEYRAGKTKVAVELFGRLVRMQPDNLQAQQLLARAMAANGDARGMAWQFDGLARQPWAPPYLLTLTARTWQGLGQPDRARGFLDRASAQGRRGAVPLPTDLPLAALTLRYNDSPNFASSAVPYARVLLGAGQRLEAQAVADRLSAANPGAADAWLVSGDARIIAGNARAALDAYEKAAAIRFNEPVLWRMDAALRAAGQAREADGIAARYLVQNPSSLAAMKLLRAAWLEEGRVEDAAAMAQALRARGQQVVGG